MISLERVKFFYFFAARAIGLIIIGIVANKCVFIAQKYPFFGV